MSVCFETCDHIVTVDLDTLIHITKDPGRKHRCYVYRLDRSLPHEDITTPPPVKRRRRQHIRRSTDHLTTSPGCEVSERQSALTLYQYSRRSS